MLLAQGVSPRVVMEILGHSQIALTMNTYTPVLPDMKRDAALRHGPGDGGAREVTRSDPSVIRGRSRRHLSDLSALPDAS
jgi:hypothetical protein